MNAQLLILLELKKAVTLFYKSGFEWLTEGIHQEKCCQNSLDYQKFQFDFSVTFLTEGSKKRAKTKHSVVLFYTQLTADCGSSRKGKQTFKYNRPCVLKVNSVQRL